MCLNVERKKRNTKPKEGEGINYQEPRYRWEINIKAQGKNLILDSRNNAISSVIGRRDGRTQRLHILSGKWLKEFLPDGFYFHCEIEGDVIF